MARPGISEPRRCVVLEGTAEETRAEALRLLARLDDDAVLWVGETTRFESVAPHRLGARLGGSFDAVVLDLHAGIDADRLGAAHGFVRGGGWLILRRSGGADPGRARLAVHPYGEDDVGGRFVARLDAALVRSLAVLRDPAPLAPVRRDTSGTEEQGRVVDALVAGFRGPPALFALTADRGRGKSSALGLALREADVDALVTAEDEAAAAEVMRFFGEGAWFVAARDVLTMEARPRVIVVDEAARLPVPFLQRLALAHPDATIAFATTTRGYEGTGRGFVLRFLTWAEGQPRPLTRLTLDAPIRWAPGDPLEALIFDALALDAAPSEVTAAVEPGPPIALDRDALASDERLLRDTFGLLVHAHYRTTPSDLHRLLDAPNLAPHAILADGRVLAATLVAREGALPDALVDAMATGSTRVKGHALPDTLVCHLGHREAGAMTMARSVRIATHPGARRGGLARALVEHVHASYDVDLFGTLFGATEDLLSFRRAVGYALVRIGASRGARTGEPSAVMVRPVSARAHAMVEVMRRELARDLPLQLALLDEDELGLAPGLRASLLDGLPEPASLDDAEEIVARWVSGPAPYEACAVAVRAWIASRDRAALDVKERALIEGRVIAGRSWRRVAEDAGYDTVPAAMRALRRAVRALLSA